MEASRRLHARNFNTFQSRVASVCRRAKSGPCGRVFPPRPAARLCVFAALLAFAGCYAMGIMQLGWIAGVALGWLPALAVCWGTAQLLYRYLMGGLGATH